MITVRMSNEYFFQRTDSFAHKKWLDSIVTDMSAGRASSVNHDILSGIQIDSVSLSDVDEGDFISRIFEGEKYKTAKKKQ